MTLLKQQVFECKDGAKEIDVYIDNGKPKIYCYYPPDRSSKITLQNGSDLWNTTIETINHGVYCIDIYLDVDAKYLYFYKEKNSKKVEEKKWKLSDYAK